MYLWIIVFSESILANVKPAVEKLNNANLNIGPQK